jgi:hypothetical protein
MINQISYQESPIQTKTLTLKQKKNVFQLHKNCKYTCLINQATNIYINNPVGQQCNNPSNFFPFIVNIFGRFKQVEILLLICVSLFLHLRKHRQ